MEVLAIILVLLTAIVVSLLTGVLIGTNRMRKAIEEGSVGHLRIDRSEVDEPPKAFLEIVGTTIESISRKKFVILKVIDENYLSRD
jgi:hypothetical protein